MSTRTHVEAGVSTGVAGGQLGVGREVFDKAGLVLRRLKHGPAARPKATDSHGMSWGVTGRYRASP
ncbi:hypothetical protein [Streptomyces sp. sk226]|uniref:hypothetical protein n=1 Tax=Streptomyces sp. sk226 TaxID=2034268 RepID=UPI0011865075|nr:hypothetical protein [Streptomyces sp. sk226]